ncbi:MAG: PorP/SprF family type IX secretion system membrane protein, partial [Bacteroidota bacterium]
MNRIIFILPFVLFVLGLKAQDPQFTQVYATPLYTCPAFAGSTIGSRFSLNMRDQWPAIPGSYVTMAASLDHYIHELNSGVGLMLLRDRAGSGRLGTTSISLLYTYDARITKLIHVRPAIQFTYGQRSIDFMKLRFNDQLYYEMESSTEIPSYESVSYPDFGTGLMVYTETYWGGFSLDHMTQPNISLIDGVSLLPRKFTLFGGYKHLISGKLGNHNEESLT